MSRQAGSGGAEQLAGWGWPVLRWGDQSLLMLGDALTAVLLDRGLAPAVCAELNRQGRPAPVLALCDVRGDQVLLAHEPFGAFLSWPLGVLPVVGCLPVPVDRSPARAGPVWVALPDVRPRCLAREIDVWAAIRTVSTLMQ